MPETLRMFFYLGCFTNFVPRGIRQINQCMEIARTARSSQCLHPLSKIRARATHKLQAMMTG